MQGQAKRRIALGVTTGGLLAGAGLGFAHAAVGSGANGGAADSPGILSGNNVQVPVDIPINICGVTANLIGLLNPAAGNDCSNGGGASAAGGSGNAGGGASAQGGAHGSPGVLSGNNVQVPVDVPVNVCGDSVNVIGAHNPAVGNQCSNGGGAGAGTTASGGASAQGGAHGSPGLLSGNNVQVPVHVPVNVCGDTVSVIGAHNSAVGNHCTNAGGAGTASGGGSTATGGAHGSPGIGSGNNVQIPIDVPVNVCGDSVNVIGAHDSAAHNSCDNGGGSTATTPPSTPPTHPVMPPPPPTSSHPGHPGHPKHPKPPVTTPPTSTPSTPTTPTTPATPAPSSPWGTTPVAHVGDTTPGGQLAHTGADGLMLAPVSAGMAGAGLVLYRKFKPTGSH